MYDEDEQMNNRDKRDSKRRSKKRFASDNRRSVRWLYWNSGRKADNEKAHEDNPNNMPRV